MKPLNRPSRAALFAAALTLCAATCAAQNAQEKRAAPPPSGLALEVNTKEGRVSHQSVPGQFFGGRYRRLPDWRPAAGSQQPRTFKVTSDLEGDGVRIKVFALMDRFHDQEVPLGEYLLRVGEKAAAEAMRIYGYEPMELTLLRVRRVPTAAPVATSRVPSVAVVGVEESQANFPSYKVVLRNLSHKDITYLEVRTASSVQWPRAERNNTLVKAGEICEVNVRGGGPGTRSPDEYTPDAPASVEVVTAIFADESYEGDAHTAVSHVASLRGQRMQIARALALWGSVAAGGAVDERAALDEFERRVLSLGRTAPPTHEGLPATIPGVSQQQYEKLKVYVEGGLDQVRRALLEDVREFRRARESSPGGHSYDAWLGGTRKKYEEWLSRL